MEWRMRTKVCKKEREDEWRRSLWWKKKKKKKEREEGEDGNFHHAHTRLGARERV